ncbi:cytochrome P460 family protein [Aureispira]|nr:cytochrome P460 family protein [Aureispira sp.]
MTKIRITILILFAVYLSVLTLNSCQKDVLQEGTTDKELYDMAMETTGFTWFKNSSAQLDRSASSGHTQPFLRTRYNTIAAIKLDSGFQVEAGATFPDGSLIVKELYDNSTTLGRYAILYKQAGHTDADANGWVWGYINSDRSIAAPASNKGISCISCHSQTDNIDYTLMNKYFP